MDPRATGLRKRRKGCDEECLRHIAARLCRLENSNPPDGASNCCGSYEITPNKSCESDECCGSDKIVPSKSCQIDECCNSEEITSSKSREANKCYGSDKTVPIKSCQVIGNTELTENYCCQKDVAPQSCCDPQSGVAAAKGKCCTPAEQPLEKSCTGTSGCRTGSAIAKESGGTCGCCDSSNDIAGPGDDCTADSCDDTKSYSCSRHLQAAFARFEAVLHKGLCLCCKVQEQLGFCCCSVTRDGRMQTSSACSTYKTATSKKASSARCSALNDTPIAKKPTGDITSRPGPSKKADARIKEKEVDIEKAAALEHVVVRVSGMTCTGCSKKVLNVLNNIPGVTNVSVAFVSETAEWDLDHTAPIGDVLRRVEKETGFTVNRVVTGYQRLDVYMSSEAAAKFEERPPDGLVSMVHVNKNLYHLTYDPHVVGARSLMPADASLAPRQPDKSVAEGRRRLWNTIMSFGASLVLTIPIVVLNWAPTDVPKSTTGIVSLVLATGVQGIAVPEFYVRAIKSLVYSRVLEMDLLVVISITAAYVYSIVAFGLTEAGIHVEQEAFFETSSLLVTLVLLGRLMSAIARVRAVSAVSIRSLQAKTALLVQPDGSISEIDARLLQFGDVIRVPPHSRLVTDGSVISGESAIDESMITGESVLIRKQVGDTVIAGTINDSGTLDISLTRLPGANSITDISSLVENAISAKPRIQDLADRLASYFVPVVIVISLVVFFIWIAIAIKVRHRNAGGAIGLAIIYAIAALAVSCPCALGLAVPMVLVITGGVAARSGVIIKAADAIERALKVTDVVFDKTGTLTLGDLRVIHTQAFEIRLPASKSISLLKALVKSNDHPVSVAISSYLDGQLHESIEVENSKSIPGAGIEATFQGHILKAGNPYWLNVDHQREVAALLSQAMTVFCVTLDDQLLLLFGLESTLRPEASFVLDELRRRHINCHIVSGDAPKTVESIAVALGIDPLLTAARSSPSEKQQYVADLQAAGKRVIFVGDGTNDAVAVAQADVGVQIGSTSDVTSAVADVVLLGGLDGVLSLLAISQRAFRRISFNFAWTVIYNIFAILMAAGAFVKFRIPPAYAGLGEIASVAPVIIAAVTLTLGGSVSKTDA